MVFGLLVILASLASLWPHNKVEAGRRKRARRAAAAEYYATPEVAAPAPAEADPMTGWNAFEQPVAQSHAPEAPRIKRYAWRCNGRGCQLVEVTE